MQNILSKTMISGFLLLTLLSSCKPNQTKGDEYKRENSGYASSPPEQQRRYQVKTFVDGDTFWLDDGSEKGIKIRLIGMDCPESRNAGKKKKHPMGKPVADYVEQLIGAQYLSIELDVQERDRYGRVLAYVYLENGELLNEHLLKKGYALLMTTPPNIKYVDRLINAQNEARNASLGLWEEE